jgi:hypothetical protein|tara:strand:- start:3965 stop:4144 length:180 start_codon:yes stop_codon:yes gene_type:complete
MNYAPIARILIRYVAAFIVGTNSAELLAGDPDIVTTLAFGIGAAVEASYAIAKRKGWAT